MNALTVPQIGKLAADAGFPPAAIPRVVAICLHESGGRPGSSGDIDRPMPGCMSIGLMAINVCPQYHNAGIWFRENPSVLYDPASNMRAAFELSGGGANFRPWTTNKLVTPAELDKIAAELQLPPGPITANPNAPTATPASLSSALDGFSKLADLLNSAHTWRRLGLTAAGVVLIGIGVALVTGELYGKDVVREVTGAVTSPAKAASNVVPTDSASPEPKG